MRCLLHRLERYERLRACVKAVAVPDAEPIADNLCVRLSYTLTGCQAGPRRLVRIESSFAFFDTCLRRS